MCASLSPRFVYNGITIMTCNCLLIDERADNFVNDEESACKQGVWEKYLTNSLMCIKSSQ